MFDVNELLSALRSGTDPDTLASELSDVLNLANKTYKAEVEEAKKKAEAEAKRKAEEEALKAKEAKRHEEMIADLADIVGELLEFFAYYYDEEIPEDTNEKEIAETILETYNSLGQFADLYGDLGFHSILWPERPKTSDGKTTKTVKNDNGKITKSETPVEKKKKYLDSNNTKKFAINRADHANQISNTMSEANRIIDDFLRELGL